MLMDDMEWVCAEGRKKEKSVEFSLCASVVGKEIVTK
jgi:hypothetical protein